MKQLIPRAFRAPQREYKFKTKLGKNITKQMYIYIYEFMNAVPLLAKKNNSTVEKYSLYVYSVQDAENAMWSYTTVYVSYNSMEIFNWYICIMKMKENMELRHW